MSAKSEYYQIKGMVSDMPPDEQAEVELAVREVTEIAQRSPAAMVGAILAMTKLAMDA
ncbi:hypothetical protein [Pseudomonas fluorescens]|uniref:Uncharacterized protein n=1 Tax=Pseudomonas fluorescens TaxID=294 RepID=A0A5E7EWC2_PSEFL|nr:hypothetical protein [Pseudomonas fluorescens]VVO30547.1 hypothetical protein PS723_04954 [Pseudomonas fluorescens]